MGSLRRPLQWTIDRMLSIGYGLVYDYIFEQFGPYQRLQGEVLELVEAAARATSPDRRAFQVLDVDCGPGNLTFVLAEAGFSVLGLEPYGALIELAREKRRARRLANLAFSQGDLAKVKPCATPPSTRWSTCTRSTRTPTRSRCSPRPGACSSRAATRSS